MYTRKLTELGEMCCACNTSTKLALQTSVTAVTLLVNISCSRLSRCCRWYCRRSATVVHHENATLHSERMWKGLYCSCKLCLYVYRCSFRRFIWTLLIMSRLTCHYQGSYSAWKILESAEFCFWNSRPLKVLENRVCPWKYLKSPWIFEL